MEFNEAEAFLDRIGAFSMMDKVEQAYIFTLAQEVKKDPIMEVGCCYGGTTLLFALAGGEVWAIDNGAGDQQESIF